MQAGKYFATGQPQVCYLPLPFFVNTPGGFWQDLGFHMDEIDHLFLETMCFSSAIRKAYPSYLFIFLLLSKNNGRFGS